MLVIHWLSEVEAIKVLEHTKAAKDTFEQKLRRSTLSRKKRIEKISRNNSKKEKKDQIEITKMKEIL